MRGLIVAFAISLALGGCADEAPDIGDLNERLCRRVVRLQSGETLEPDQLRSLARGLREDAEDFGLLGEDATAARVGDLADHLDARADDPDNVPPRAVDARLLSLCVAGNEGQ